MNDQKAKAEKVQKQLVQKLNECTSKMSVMEREIVLYKERLQQLKTKSSNQISSTAAAAAAAHNDSNQFIEESSSFMTEKNKSISTSALNHASSGGGGGAGSNSFFIRNNSSTQQVAESNTLDWDAAERKSNGTISQSSIRTVKVSRRDLRRLNEDEVVKRSLKKDQS